MGDIRADVALLPIGGTYTMNAEEAAAAVKCIKPRTVVPMHYGRIVGEMDDAHRFSQLVEDAEVAILPEEERFSCSSASLPRFCLRVEHKKPQSVTISVQHVIESPLVRE